MSIDVFTSSKTVEWGTPTEVLEPVRSRFDLTLDVCATPGREVCKRYYSPPIEEIGKYKDDEGVEQIDQAQVRKALEAWGRNPPIGINALLQSWVQDVAGGVAWMNPPFGRAIKEFIKQAKIQADRGLCVVAIVPSRTGTAWWHDYVEPVRTGKFPGEFEFFRGRITFISASGLTDAPAPFDMAKVVWDGRRL